MKNEVMEEKKKYKVGFKSYFETTPRRVRRIGNTLLTTATTASTFSFAMDNKMIGIIIFVVGCVGKLITEFFSDK